MSRLISMEDAIRAIEEEWDGCCSEYPATQIIYNTTEAIERLPTIQPEITHEQAVEYLQSTGWMQEHDRQMMLDGAHRLTAQPEPHEIGYDDCANALLKMWMDNVLTDGDYYRIADKLNKKWGKTELLEPYTEPYKGGDGMTNEEAIRLVDDRMCYGRGKWSRHHQPVIDEYWQAGEMAIKALEAEPHWIPVEQDLPKENYLDDGYVEPSQPVIVYMNYHAYKISRYWGHRKSKGTSDYVIPDWMDLEEYDGENVIAWCELPEPYKEVTE